MMPISKPYWRMSNSGTLWHYLVSEMGPNNARNWRIAICGRLIPPVGEYPEFTNSDPQNDRCQKCINRILN